MSMQISDFETVDYADWDGLYFLHDNTIFEIINDYTAKPVTQSNTIVMYYTGMREIYTPVNSRKE